ncbi:expressed unknown protein [Seminavis robusta]|uniref:Uncharacterized protein n=1 Tax=Seminavis robusta TaxID=568900 RepID=A0A9N8HQ71_9STRA|nr:expressed unknown protein [Seminavis robusta]|eukprot:Sro959_g224730.1 n/a (502) ;mRNA; r:7370-8975
MHSSAYNHHPYHYHEQAMGGSSRRQLHHEPHHQYTVREESEEDHHHHHRRSSSRHLDEESVVSESRFMSGSNRDYDQAPSIHVVKSRGDFEDDRSERSFQLGVDPIERDWGDARSRDYRGAPLNHRSSRHSSNEGSMHRHSNATYKPRRLDEYAECDEADFCRRRPLQEEGDPYCDGDRGGAEGDTMATRSLTNSSYCSHRSSMSQQQLHRQQHHTQQQPQQQQPYHPPPQHRHPRASLTCRYGGCSLDQGEQARPSRPDNGHAPPQHRRNTPYRNLTSSSTGSSSGIISDYDRRLSSNVSSSGSSVCSRSAPARRTPIPREPSLYQANSSCHSSNSRRTFEYRRRSTEDYHRRKDSGHVIPAERMDQILIQQQKQQQHYPRGGRRASDPTHGCQNSNTSEAVMVDIAPGVQAPLRGTQETYKAVSKDYYANVSCFGCSMELCCIADVSYVVCPECKVISPLEGILFEGKETQRHGLGLGFSYESLFQMQVEIMKERKSPR